MTFLLPGSEGGEIELYIQPRHRIRCASRPEVARLNERSETLRLEPGRAVLGELAPTAVDGERVPAAREPLELRDRWRLAICRERALHQDRRHRVVPLPREEQQRAAACVPHVDLRRRLRVEGRRRGLEDDPAWTGHGVPGGELLRLLLGERVGESEAELVLGQGDSALEIE